MEVLMALIIIAVLIQAIVDGIKGALCKWDWLSLFLGAILCPLAKIDAFELLDVSLAAPFIGSILTGIIVGRGAAAVYDIWDKIKNTQSTTTTTKQA